MKRWVVCLLPLLLLSSAIAQEAAKRAGKTYAQSLIDRAVAAHPEIRALSMRAKGEGGTTGQLILAALGKDHPSAAMILAVERTGATKAAANSRAQLLTISTPLLDASHRPLGVLTAVYSFKRGDDRNALVGRAEALRDGLSRRISHLKNLTEPAVFDPAIPTDSYAQHLVDDELERHREVVILALHAVTPKNSDAAIIASNIGRIGKKADDDDRRVINTGVPNKEVNETGDRFEAELPLYDVSGTTLGAVGVVFDYKTGVDKEKLVSAAEAIRDDLKRHISNPANLVEPYPYDAALTDRSYAQSIVDRSLADHPDILILALHVTPPGQPQNVIVASNIGRIGKKADDDDMRVVNTGAPNLEVNEKGNRFEVESVLHDVAGNKIGAISVVYAYKNGDDKAALHGKADQVESALSREIPTLASLFEAPQQSR